MSAPLAGKFQDHYALLGIDPRATAEVLQAAYDKLTEKYHPSNSKTGDEDKFESVKLAYEVLSDPILRAEFDKIKGIDLEDANLQFAGAEFFDALGRQSGLRNALLCILYDKRRKKPYKPSLSMRHIEGILDTTNDEMNFALFYLKQRNLVASDDKSNLQITVDGMDFLERDRPAPEKVYPFIKPGALFIPATAAAAPSAPPEVPPLEIPPAEISTADAVQLPAVEIESVLKVLTRALARR